MLILRWSGAVVDAAAFGGLAGAAVSFSNIGHQLLRWRNRGDERISFLGCHGPDPPWRPEVCIPTRWFAGRETGRRVAVPSHSRARSSRSIGRTRGPGHAGGSVR